MATEIEREQSRKRISKFFFGSDDQSWETLVTQYRILDDPSGYEWDRAAASDTLSEFSDEDKQILLAEEKQLELEKLE